MQKPLSFFIAAPAMKTLAALFALILLLVSSRPSFAAETGWLKLKVGQTAYLAAQMESDSDPNTRPVCRTNAAQIAFMKMELNDCPHRKWGTIVVVTDILPGFNDDRTSAFDKTIPFVGIRAQSGRWTGWVQSISLEPIIPVGTKLVMKTSGNAIPSVYLKKDAPMKSDVELGSPVTVEVVRQDAPTDGNCSLLVKVLTGPKAGLSGWTCDDGMVEGHLDAGFLQ